MSDRNAAAYFYFVAFALALAVAFNAQWLGESVLVVTMFTPLVSVLVVHLAVRKGGRSIRAWRDVGVHRPGFRYWPQALIFPLLVLLPGYLFVWSSGLTEFAPTDDFRPGRDGLRLIVSLFVGACLGALGEEVGWRGFLLPRLMGIGFWPASLLTGFLHGAWHLPLILLTPYYHATGAPLLTIVLFLTTFTLAGGVYGYLRIAALSIWPVAIMHRSVNLWWERFDDLTVTDSPDIVALLAGESGLFPILALIVLLFLIHVFARPGRSGDDSTGTEIEYRSVTGGHGANRQWWR